MEACLEKKKGVQLALIVIGEPRGEVKKKIPKCNLEDNVIFFGFKDDAEKLKRFKQSKVVVHPMIYDSD